MIIKLDNGKKMMFSDPETIMDIYSKRIAYYSNLNRPLNSAERDDFEYMKEVYTKLLEKKKEENFLYGNESLESMELPKVRQVGDAFIGGSIDLSKIHLPELEQNYNNIKPNTDKIDIPKVKDEENFLYGNESLENIELPKVKDIDGGFIDGTADLSKLHIPSIEERMVKYYESLQRPLTPIEQNEYYTWRTKLCNVLNEELAYLEHHINELAALGSNMTPEQDTQIRFYMDTYNKKLEQLRSMGYQEEQNVNTK